MEIFGVSPDEALDIIVQWGFVIFVAALFLGWVLGSIRESLFPINKGGK